MTSLRSILFVVPRFHTNLYFATRALAAAGVRVTLWCTGEGPLEDHGVVRPVILGDAEIAAETIGARLRALAPDLVVLREAGPLSLLTGKSARRQGRKLVGYDQKPYLRAPRSPLFGLRERLAGKPRHRITPVPGLPGAGRRPDPRATYVPFPVGLIPEGERRDYAPGGRTRILCVGKLNQPRKNHAVLLEALASLGDVHDFTLTLCGSSQADVRGATDENLTRLRALSERPPLAGRVQFVADLPFRDMAALYREHDICVLPASKEPLGSSPLEAMGWGTVPVISSECGSAGYIVGTGVGHVVPPGDVAALAHGLATLMATRAGLETAGRAALALARRELAPDVFVDRVQRLAAALP